MSFSDLLFLKRSRAAIIVAFGQDAPLRVSLGNVIFCPVSLSFMFCLGDWPLSTY